MPMSLVIDAAARRAVMRVFALLVGVAAIVLGGMALSRISGGRILPSIGSLAEQLASLREHFAKYPELIEGIDSKY